jgi:hypothetical protein
VRSTVASSSENGPGTPGGGTGKPVTAVTASSSAPSHGLRDRGPHTATTARPPGTSTRRISAAAIDGGSTNMSASRERTTS